MEARIATGTEDTLLDALSFELESVADYVVSRNTVTFQVQGSLTYDPRGGRLIRFVLSDNAMFLDPSSVRLSFRLKNTSQGAAPDLQLLAPHSMWYRVRLLCNSTLVEDITYLNRTVSMYERVLPSYRRISNTLESNWQEPIAAGESRRFVQPIPVGLMNQDKYIWLKVCPLQFEIELVSNYLDCAQGNSADLAWEIDDVRILADSVHVTAEFSDNISRSLLRSVPLPMSIVTYAVNKIGFSLAGQSQFTVNINRALTRLKSIWWTMEAPVARDGYNPPARDVTLAANKLSTQQGAFLLDGILSRAHAGGANEQYDYKTCNSFYHPYQGQVPRNVDETFEWQIQIGGSFYPALPIKGIYESAWMLHKTCGMCWQGSTDIPLKEFANQSFIGAYSFEKAINCAGKGAAYSGESTVAGQQISLIVKGLTEANAPGSVTVVLCHDLIMNIRTEGTEVLI
jgi:hypothetical protein